MRFFALRMTVEPKIPVRLYPAEFLHSQGHFRLKQRTLPPVHLRFAPKGDIRLEYFSYSPKTRGGNRRLRRYRTLLSRSAAWWTCTQCALVAFHRFAFARGGTILAVLDAIATYGSSLGKCFINSRFTRSSSSSAVHESGRLVSLNFSPSSCSKGSHS